MRNRILNPALTLAVVFLLLLTCFSRVFALEQMNNANFTAGSGSWNSFVDNTPTDLANFTLGRTPLGETAAGGSEGDIANECFQGYIRADNAGGPTISSKAIGRLEQSFPLSGALSTDANVEVAVSYKQYAYNSKFANGSNSSGSPVDWLLDLSGGVFLSGGTQVGTSFLSISESRNTVYGPTAWTRSPTWTATLPAGDTFFLRMKWQMGAIKANKFMHVMAWVDQMYVNLSPQGLVATETSTGACQLTWNPSTCPATVPQLAVATDCYRIYKSLTSGGPWALHSSTNIASWSEIPSEDEAYYCITDVDTSGQESPKSVQAIF